MANLPNLIGVICKIDVAQTTIVVDDGALLYRVVVPQPRNLSPANAPNIASGTGSASGTATGDLVGEADGFGTESTVSNGRVVGTAAGSGIGTGTADQAEVVGIGSEIVSAAGEVVGLAIGSGAGFGVVVFEEDVAEAAGFGEGTGTALAANAAFTRWLDDTLLFTFSGAPIVESDSAFEQSGRVVFTAERIINNQSQIWLYWFDPVLNRFVFQFFAFGRNPRVLLDNPLNTTDSDVLLFYIRSIDQKIVYRQQRDRYAIERETPIAAIPHSYVDLYLQDVAKGRDGRLVIIYAQHTINSGKWNYGRLESALYPLVLDVDSIMATKAAFQSGSLDSIIKNVLTFGQPLPVFPVNGWLDPDEFEAVKAAFLTTSSLNVILIEAGPPGTLTGAGGAVPFHTDVDEFAGVKSEFESGTLVQVLFSNTLFDIDEFIATKSAFQSSGSSLIQVLFPVTLFDIDQYKANVQFVASGSSLAP